MALAIFFVPLKDVVKLASGFKIMIFMMINSCVIILRQTSKEHDWNPSYNSPMYPYIQLWGIVAGAVLIAFIGNKAFIGAGAAVVAGAATYFLYGKKHAVLQTTPVASFRKQFQSPSPTEHERRITAFHAADMGGKNHLTVREFQRALKALGLSYTSDESRAIFHAADADSNGVIDIDEFFEFIETTSEE
jgi:hypothetical protein